MRTFKNDNSGSVVPTLIFILLLGFISFIFLVANIYLEIFMNLMAPGPMRQFFSLIFPYGSIIILFFIIAFSYVLYMQKSKYSRVR